MKTKKGLYLLGTFIILTVAIIATILVFRSKVVETNITVNTALTSEEYVVGEFDLTKLQLSVTMSDNSNHFIYLKESMINLNDLTKLKTVGTHTVTITYKKLSTTINIKIVNKSEIMVKHTVTFVSNNEDIISQFLVNEDSTVLFPSAPIIDNYSFTHWESEGNVIAELTTINEDMIIKAVYERYDIFDIVFDTKDGTDLANIEGKSNIEIKTLPVPEKADYKFKYWYYGGKELTLPYRHIENTPLELTAIYDQNSNGLLYNVINNEVLIYGYDGNSEEVIIPNDIAGLPVVEILEFTFQGNEDIKVIRVGKHVRHIKEHAFEAMINLTSITFENEMQTITTGILENSNNLEFMQISAEANIELHQYFGGTLINAKIPSTLKLIKHANNATVIQNNYTNYSKYEITLQLADDLTNIKQGQFEESLLYRVIIPKGVEAIQRYGFGRSNNLSSVVFEEGSKLNTIAFGAFYFAYSLRDIVLPNSVILIGQAAFERAPLYDEFILPLSLTYVMQDAFLDNTEVIKYKSRIYTIPSTWHSDWNPNNKPVTYFVGD